MKIKELQFRKTEHVAFVNITNAKAGETYFTYSEKNKCFGSGDGSGFVPAFGRDKFDEGFDFGEQIKIGVFRDGKFFTTTGTAINYFTQEESIMKFASLAIYFYEIESDTAEEIELEIDSELTEVILELRVYDEKPKHGDNVFIKLVGVNVESPTVFTNGKGELKQVRRYLTGFGFYDYIYTPSPDDAGKSLFFNAVSLSSFDREMCSTQKVVTMPAEKTQPGIPANHLENEVVRETEDYTIYIDNSKKNLKLLYIESKGAEIDYRVFLMKDGKRQSLNQAIVKSKQKRLIINVTEKYDAIKFQWLRIDGVTEQKFDEIKL